MFIIIIFLLYLIQVAIVNFIQILVNLIFGTNFDYNVWLLAILFMLLQIAFRNTITTDNKNKY